MCAVSNIGDMGRRMWPGNDPNDQPYKYPYNPGYPGNPIPMPGIGGSPFTPPYDGPTREQFEELLKLLRAARAFDVATGQPDCEDDEKTKWLKAIGEKLGVKVTF